MSETRVEMRFDTMERMAQAVEKVRRSMQRAALALDEDGVFFPDQ